MLPHGHQLFAGEAQAACYALHRPQYPEELWSNIMDFAGLAGPVSSGSAVTASVPDAGAAATTTAVDIGCGSGQATLALAALVDSVVALDGSEEQLRHARAQPGAPNNVAWRLADGHATGLPSGCADLVTVAQALHWFRHTELYDEVRRLLKPTGTLAAWSYGLPILEHRQHPAQAALLQLYDGVLGPYWDPRRRLVEAGYRGIEPTPEDFGVVVRRELESAHTQTVEQLLGYLRSWSAYAAYVKHNPGEPDPLVDFELQLLAALKATDRACASMTVILPFSLIMAKEPRPPQRGAAPQPQDS